MENNPVAPTGEQAPASVASTNSNEAPTSPQVPEQTQAPAEPTAEQIAKYLGTTPESLEKAKKFYENNGGFDKVFSERKAEISTPKAQQTQSQIPGSNQSNDSPTQTQTITPQQPMSNLNMQNIEAKYVRDYFNELATKPEYANIADKLRDGTVMEMATKQFGISMFANGDVNRDQFGKFAEMYSKTLPPAPASAPVTNTPTVSNEPSNFEGPIADSSTALKIIQESNQLKAAGKGIHPRYEDAKKFLSEGFSKRNPRPKEFQPYQKKTQ